MLDQFMPEMILPTDYAWEYEFATPKRDHFGNAIIEYGKARGMGYAYKQALKRIRELEVQCGRHGPAEDLGHDSSESMA